MSAIPVGYEAFHSFRRKAVTLICFVLASGMISGLTVYVDSYSVHEWDSLIGDNPVAMFVMSDYDLEQIVDEVRDIPSVTKAQLLEASWGNIQNLENIDWWNTASGSFIAPTQEFLENFTELFGIVEGRFPQNNTEIAIEGIVAEYHEFKIGTVVNVTGESGWTLDSRLLTIVGVYKTIGSEDSVDPWGYYYSDFGIAMVYPETFAYEDYETKIYVDIDRSRISPFDAAGSLSYVMGIEQKIRELDPMYGPPRYSSRYYIRGLLSGSIVQFTNWQFGTRLNQILRASSVILLAGFVMFLAIRHNVNERRYETSMLMSRGASEASINNIANREFFILSFFGTIFAIIIGILFSRFAISTTGFMEFDPVLFFNEPVLITLESLIMSILIGFFLPIGTLLAYRVIYSTRKPIEEEQGRLAKVAKTLTIIRWDFLMLSLTCILMIAIIAGGPTAITELGFFLTIAPLTLFLSVASLSIKGLKKGANRISRGMKRIVGDVSAAVGIRRIGKGASSAGPVVIVLVLAMSMAWSYAVIGASMPVTKINHARFAIGGDSVFHLDDLYEEHWESFKENLTSHDLVEAATIVSVFQMQLSSTGGGSYDVIALDPEEYRQVGYDYNGIALNNTALGDALMQLQSNPSGAIITTDIAVSYNLDIGDTFRTFQESDVEQGIFTFSVIQIEEGLTNGRLLDSGNEPPNYWYYYSPQVGSRVIWINKEFISSQLNLTEEANSVMCVRTHRGANSTIVVEDVLSQGGDLVVAGDNWATAQNELDSFLNGASYHMDRSVDNMLMVVTIGIVFGAFVVYAAEGVTSRRREVALLRSIGADSSLVIKTQTSEMLILLCAGALLLFGYGPISFMISILTYPTSYYTYPISVFPIIPWTSLLIVFALFIVSILAFIVIVASVNSKVNLAAALNAAWAESGPYGGDV